MNHCMTQSGTPRGLRPNEFVMPPAATPAYLWSHTPRLKQVLDVMRALEAWPDATIVADRSGLCISLRGVRLGHLHWNGRLDLPLGPEIRDRLVAEMMAIRSHDDPDDGHVVFDVRTAADVDHAVWLLRRAYLSLDSKVDPCSAGVAPQQS
jgi:hypothetical protein